MKQDVWHRRRILYHMQVRPRWQSLVLITVGDPPDSGLSGLVVAHVSMSSSFTHMLIITPDFAQRSGC